MKIKKDFSFWRVLALFTILALFSQRAAYAEDEENLPLPAPAEMGDLPPPLPTPVQPPVMDAPAEDTYLPSVSESRPPEAQFQKNEAAEDNYLPPPSAEPLPAPTSAPISSFSYSDEELELKGKTGMEERPRFGIFAGGATRFYPSSLVPERSQGLDFGATIPLFEFNSSFRVNFNPSISSFSGRILYPTITDPSTGISSSYELGFKDITTRFGATAEFYLSRRFSLMAGVTRIKNHIHPDHPLKLATDLGNIELKKAEYRFGAGAQWDFYVRPHGNFGVRAYAEPDFWVVSLVLNVESAPREKITLKDFD